MKVIYKLSSVIFTALLLFLTVGCDDDINYNRGPVTDPNSPGVYFASMEDPSLVIDLNAPTEAKLILERVNADKAVSAPIRVSYAPIGLSIPATVEFAANEKQAELIIKYTEEFEQNIRQEFRISIDPAYTMPYAEVAEGSSEFIGGLTVYGVWEDFVTANAKFTSKSSNGKPIFGDFKQKIQKRGNQYRIDNFLLNNEGHGLEFTLDANKQILPLESVGYHDTSAKRWYFYKGPSSASANRIPCYLPIAEGSVAGDYITYVYFYTVGSSDSRYAFELDEYTKTGKIGGYARYSKSSAGAFIIELSWD